MASLLKSFGFSVVSLGVISMCTNAFSAPDAYTSRADAARVSVNSARMPTMRTLPIGIAGGNMVTNLPSGSTTTVTTTTTTTTACDASYTIDDCMSDINECVNSGIFPNGLNDLFNDGMWNDVRNSTGWCASQIDKCKRSVCNDNKNGLLFENSKMVWNVFGARVRDPEYYGMVLRRTGLTPTQAQRVCSLLDSTTYGESYTAENAQGVVRAENDRQVRAYNEQNDNKVKNAERDAKRGHYARWDAVNGECLVRVAAYNKDKLITNSFLWGAIGDTDEYAEAWKPAGTSFTCNKDLFGFSLFEQTKDAALIGVAGGAVVGAGVGAGIGAGIKANRQNQGICSNEELRNKMARAYITGGRQYQVSKFIAGGFELNKDGSISKDACVDLQELAAKYAKYKQAINDCPNAVNFNVAVSDCNDNQCQIPAEATKVSALRTALGLTGTAGQAETVQKSADDVASAYKKVCTDQGLFGSECVAYWLKNGVNAQVDPTKHDCDLKSFEMFNTLACEDADNPECQTADKITESIKSIAWIANIPELQSDSHVQGKNLIGKGAAIGGATGAAAGGLATAITAFVEKGNISCHVGDGLDKVGFGKSYSIDSLRDFWVKWKLQDNVSSVITVKDCTAWKKVCDNTDVNDCSGAHVVYTPTNGTSRGEIYSACTVESGKCVINTDVAKAYGLWCKTDGTEVSLKTPTVAVSGTAIMQ